MTKSQKETAEVVKSLRKTGRYFIALVVLIGLGLLYNGWRTYDLSKDTKHDIRAASLEACDRGNESRVGRVIAYKRDIETMRSDLDFVRSFTSVFPVDGPLRSWEQAKSRAIDYKRDAIRSEIDAVKEYAVEPGSPIVNCEAAYPPL